MQLAPILNKINTFLQSLLEDLGKLSDSDFPLESDVAEEYSRTFQWSCNLLLTIPNESPSFVAKTEQIDSLQVSYLDHLTSFLRYYQEPLYALRVANLVSRFASFSPKISSDEGLKIFFDLLAFTTPFLNLLNANGNKLDTLQKFLETRMSQSFRLSDWSPYRARHGAGRRTRDDARPRPSRA